MLLQVYCLSVQQLAPPDSFPRVAAATKRGQDGPDRAKTVPIRDQDGPDGGAGPSRPGAAAVLTPGQGRFVLPAGPNCFQVAFMPGWAGLEEGGPDGN